MKKGASTSIKPADVSPVPAVLQGDWAFEGDSADILIPKILLAQSTSKVVQDEKVAFGSLYKSTTLLPIGGRDKSLQIIPLYHNKTWVLSQKVAGKYEFDRTEPFTAENRDKEWHWKENNVEWKREQSLNFFVLIPREIDADVAARVAMQETGEMPDTDDSLLPCAISFKVTSYRAGKALVTHFAKASDFGMPPFVSYFELTTKKESNDQGTFYIMEIGKGGKTKPEHLEACAKWRAIVAHSTAVKIDDSDLVRDTPHGDPGPGSPQF